MATFAAIALIMSHYQSIVMAFQVAPEVDLSKLEQRYASRWS